MDWSALILGGVLAVAILLAGQYALVILTLRRLRLAPPAMAEHIALDAVPPAHAELLALAAPRLTALGFHFEFATRAPSALLTSKPCPQYCTYWCHLESGAWAVVSLSDQPEFDALYKVAFYTFYEPGPHLYTLARRAHEQALVVPQYELVDSGGDLEHQWQTHRERMQGRDSQQLIRDPDGIARIEQRLPDETRAAFAASNMLVVERDGSARLNWAGARRYMQRYREGLLRLRRTPLAAADANGIDADAPRAAELRAAADAIAMSTALAAQRQDPGRHSKTLLLLVTGLASLLLFGWRFDWQFGVVLVGVLLLHELGHLVAMRAAGYRDLQVFFIPLFGAMASGREQQATAWQKMLVLLAGPLPGIVLGCALLFAFANQQVPMTPWLASIASTLLVINIFNLLPLVPLDGGRFFDVLLTPRMPRARGAFAALGAASLFAAGLWWQTPLMTVLGALLLLGVPAQLRQARLLAALRAVHVGGMDSKDEWLLALARLSTASEYRAQPYAQRLALARSITASALAPAPSMASTMVGLALYALGIALPVWTFGQYGVDLLATLGANSARSQSAPATRDIDKELAALPDAAARITLLLRAASEAEDGEDYERARDYFKRALALSDGLPNSRQQQVDATLGLARNMDDTAEAEPLLKSLLASLDGSDKDTRLTRAQVLMALSQGYSPATRSTDIAQLHEVVSIRGELLPAAHPDLLGSRQVLAWLLWQAGDGTRALAELRARLDAVMAEPCDAKCNHERGWLRVEAWSNLVWLQLALGAPEAAAQLLEEHGEATKALSSMPRGEQQDIIILDAWVRDSNGDHSGALSSLAALYEQDHSPPAALNELQVLIDLASFAERAGDDDATAEWHGRLRERVTALRKRNAGLSLGWLRNSREAPFVWWRARLDAEIAWLEKHEPALLAAPVY